MKKTRAPGLVVAFSLLGICALMAQEKGLPSYSGGSKTELAVKTGFFEAERKGEPGPKRSAPDILFVAKIYPSGLPAEVSLQLESLKDFFCLPELRLMEDSPETKISWAVSKEIYDEKGKFIRNEEEESRAKIRKTAFMNGAEYTVFLIPQEIKTRENIFKFLLEVYKTQGGNEPSSLAAVELLAKKEMLWNFDGPLAMVFFFDEKIYFLTFTVEVSISSWGGRLASRISWTI